MHKNNEYKTQTKSGGTRGNAILSRRDVDRLWPDDDLGEISPCMTS